MYLEKCEKYNTKMSEFCDKFELKYMEKCDDMILNMELNYVIRIFGIMVNFIHSHILWHFY